MLGRLLGRPILSDVALQDVLFTRGRDEDMNASMVAVRETVPRLNDLGNDGRKQEKQDLRALREGLLRMTIAGTVVPGLTHAILEH